MDERDKGSDSHEVEFRNAGLSQTIDTWTCRPLMRSLKDLSPLLITLNGPSYGFCSDARTASCHTKCVYLRNEH